MMGKRELVALLYLSSWCLVMVEWLFLAVPWVCLRFVIVVFPDHTHLLFLWFVTRTLLVKFVFNRGFSYSTQLLPMVCRIQLIKVTDRSIPLVYLTEANHTLYNGCQYDIWVKGQGFIYQAACLHIPTTRSFDGGHLYLTQCLPVICR